MNDIQRRLADIDRELSRSPSYYFNRAVAAAPLVFCAAGMIGGIVIENYLPITVLFWLLLLIVSVLISIASLVPHLSSLRKFYLLPSVVIICFACLGAIRLASFNKPGPYDVRNSAGDEPAPATLRGVIETEPYMDANDWAFARFAHADPGSSFYLKVTEAESTAGWVNASGLVRVRVQEPVLDLRPGDYVQIYCLLNRFAGATNPGEFDIAKYLARKGVFVGASVKSRGAIEVMQINRGGSLIAARTILRRIAVTSLIGGSEPENEPEKLLLALVLGLRSNIDHATIEAFRKTGLLHFICLSGMNFGIVIWFIWWACKTAGLMKPASALVCMLSAVLFLLVVPDNAPAFRAAVMCFAFCGSFIFRRNSNPFNSLALAAIVLLLISPAGLFEPGWQLSFVSVLGILLFAKPIETLLCEKLPKWLAAPFSVSLTAWLSSAGILLYHFGTIQPLTSVWTVLVSPLIGLVSILGYLKLVIGLFSPSISALIGILTNFFAGWLIRIVKMLARLDVSEILVGNISIVVIILYYALIIYAGFFNFKYRLIKKTVLATGIPALAVILLLPAWQGIHREILTITALDVGHGQAVIAHTPDGRNLIFDAGSLSRDNIGARVVTPFLKYNRLTKIDALIISHGDIDHINGIPEIVQDTQMQDVFASSVFLNDDRPTVKFLQGELTQEVKNINDLPQEFGQAKIKILWPSRDILENNQVSDNDKSIVTLIEYAGRRILVTSDAEKFAQAEILRLYPDLSVDVLIAPHHGSRKTLEPQFLESLKPSVVISSCTGAAFEKGQVIKQSGNYSSYYTGKDGAVTVRIDRNGDIKTTAFNTRK